MQCCIRVTLEWILRSIPSTMCLSFQLQCLLPSLSICFKLLISPPMYFIVGELSCRLTELYYSVIIEETDIHSNNDKYFSRNTQWLWCTHHSFMVRCIKPDEMNIIWKFCTPVKQNNWNLFSGCFYCRLGMGEVGSKWILTFILFTNNMYLSKSISKISMFEICRPRKNTFHCLTISLKHDFL